MHKLTSMSKKLLLAANQIPRRGFRSRMSGPSGSDVVEGQSNSESGSAGRDSREQERGNPCTRICRYKKDFFDGPVCIGCFRDGHEIANWSQMSEQERAWALADAKERNQVSLGLLELVRALVFAEPCSSPILTWYLGGLLFLSQEWDAQQDSRSAE